MSPDQTAGRLLSIADEIDSTRHLVEAAEMATTALEPEQARALAGLLGLVRDRLKAVSREIAPRQVEEVA